MLTPTDRRAGGAGGSLVVVACARGAREKILGFKRRTAGPEKGCGHLVIAGVEKWGPKGECGCEGEKNRLCVLCVCV